MTFDDFAIDRHHFAGMNDDEIADHDFDRGNGSNDAVAQNPGDLGLIVEQFAHRAARTGSRQIADVIAKMNEPRDDRAGQKIILRDRGADRQSVEEIDIEPLLAADDAKGALGDRIGVPQEQRRVDRDRNRIGKKRKSPTKELAKPAASGASSP